jgi:hypothetical protein
VTIFSVAGGKSAVTVRYIPVVTWAFAAVAAYGVADIVARMADGRIPISPATLGSLLLLVAFAGYVCFIGGQVVFATFDRAADLVLVRRYGINGFSRTERRLSEITGLEVRVLRKAQHRVELRFASGERMPLTSYYVVTFNTRGIRRLSEMLGVEPSLAEEARPQGGK